MTGSAARQLPSRPGGGSAVSTAQVFADHEEILAEETARLVGLIDPGFLTEAGWDRATRTL